MEEVPLATFNNASLWSNLTSWTAQHLRDAVSVSKYAESILQKLGSFGNLLPIDNFGQHLIPQATAINMLEEAAADTVAAAAATEAALTHEIRAAAASAASSVLSAVDQQYGPHDVPTKLAASDNGKGIGSFFSYVTSKWALSCILMALVLNRTHIFAATRRRLRLKWHTRVALRIVPYSLLYLYALRVLRSIQCQTSPDFSELRWNNASMKSDVLFANPNAFFNHLSSSLLFGATDRQSCEAIHMIPIDSYSKDILRSSLRGSLSILWPLYGVFCLSQFLETISCSVQGRAAASETGMTLFEISLAFAEADSALGNYLGWSVFPGSSSNSTVSSAAGQTISITRTMILNRVNTPVEVLIVALICIMTHLTSHLLGMFQLQSRLRLAQTSFWALMFLGCILTSFYNFSLENPMSQGLLRFPTVCLIGHIPHIIVLVGILICFAIYAVALVVAVIAPAPQESGTSQADGIPSSPRAGFWTRLSEAHGNMQANLSLGETRITASTDFYTALLRAGLAVISMASEAVYLQEDRSVNLKQSTWLEDERYRELENMRSGLGFSGLPGAVGDMTGTIGLIPISEDQIGRTNGYARERANQEVSKVRLGERKPRTGVGAAERSARWFLAVEYFLQAIGLLMRIYSKTLLACMAWVGLRWRPRWLVYLSEPARRRGGKDDEAKEVKRRLERRQGTRHPEWEILSDGITHVPRRREIDVEEWMRRSMPEGEWGEAASERQLDRNLYGWWLKGGFWGNQDLSGEYVPAPEEDGDDTTSVVSGAGTDDSENWESLDEGQKTPTQTSINVSLLRQRRNVPAAAASLLRKREWEREESPDIDNSPMEISDLARLLNPSSPEEREKAQNLAAHLESDGIVTRSRYARQQMRQKARVLLPASAQGAGAGMGRNGRRLGPEEEERVLEQILLSRRTQAAAEGKIPQQHGGGGAGGASNWVSGAAGMGDAGPQCVVCHSEPRTIIVWPCRCLSLCDECRVNLAMNNYGNCVCCRREVVSFSRIYVP